MIWSIHPGIWGAFFTLATGLTANVVVSSAYQANGGLTLDFDNLSEEIINGTFDPNNEAMKKQYELLLHWRTASTWYIANCKDETKLKGNEKNQKYCLDHKKLFYKAPEVRQATVTTEELQRYFNTGPKI
ncbi:hypothetical protein MHLP_04415 [Candidatus Mycoplasma haematolamae str. Purdue]|uniref:Uncharacterized protein n=1 Tax=Mycoplasma haematolamae (strain Purdue) TaxID=1212765 RepID=I7BKP5_MYCHA|nr:hypothetical protein [Candidatus Mycoplasma haematolamae]AFO52463.1 hypothetical protein MHLP_04415 [Candidatus Mycoplasma haematolamae str. Purdue]